jgi:hypothetical protein
LTRFGSYLIRLKQQITPEPREKLVFKCGLLSIKICKYTVELLLVLCRQSTVESFNPSTVDTKALPHHPAYQNRDFILKEIHKTREKPRKTVIKVCSDTSKSQQIR